MATATGFTAARMQAIEDSCIVSGAVVLDSLMLTRHDGSQFDAGVVRGDKGDQGAPGIQGIQGIQGPKGDQSLAAGTISLWTSDVAPTNWIFCDGAAISRTTYASLFAAIGVKYGAGDGSTTFNVPNLKGRVPAGKDAAQTEFATLAQTGGEKTHILTTAEMPSHTHTQNSHGHTLTNAVVAAANHIHSLSSAAWAYVSMIARTTNQIEMRRIATTNGASSTHSLNYTALGGGAGVYAEAMTSAAELGGNTDAETSTTTVSAQSTTATNQNTGGDGAHNNLQPYTVVNFIIKTANGDTDGDSQLTQRVSNLESSQPVLQPTGVVNAFSGTAAPNGWLLCDGSAVSRATYANLFAVIGSTYGPGDGSTTFNTPNLKGRVIAGVDAAQSEFAALNQTGGEKTHKLTVAEMPSHTHTQNSHSHTQDPHNHFYNSGSPTTTTGTRLADTSTAAAHTITSSDTTATNQATTATNQNTGGDGTHNNLQPYLVLNYIIKT